MSRYSLRNRSSYDKYMAKEDELMPKNPAKNIRQKSTKKETCNLSPSILKKFQKMSTFSPHKTRSIKKSSSNSRCMDKKDLMGADTHDLNEGTAIEDPSSLVMCDDDMLPVELPEKYNYEIWEDPELDNPQSMNTKVEPMVYEADEKENLWKPSVLLHAFSPFKRNREERALKALSIASLPEYLHIKGQFFNDLGASLFKRKEKDRSRFKATKINLFGRRYYQKPQKASSKNIYVGKVDVDDDFDPAFSIPTPEVAKPANMKSTNIQFSPMEQSTNSAFKSLDKIDLSYSKSDQNHDSNATSIDRNFNTPFNTPRSEFIERTSKIESIETNQQIASSKDYKKNLRPRPTRPPTLFGFSPDASEDEVHGTS